MAKKTLSQDQEFQVMLLVLDKFLWLGFAIMGYGMWLFFTRGLAELSTSLSVFIAGAVVLVLFMILILKEYRVLR
ncbi:hypothetical protein HYS47_02215 [Candidatus Woesearchaeota archaeon]|nr:hypothetical protein [Candidatus Woesearchaeota archaeon]